MLISLDEYRNLFHWGGRQWFRDCAVRSKDAFYFITEPEYSDEKIEEEEDNGWNPDLRPKIILGWIRIFEPGKQWFGSFKNGWQPMVLGTSLKPGGHSVSIEMTSTFPSMDHKCHIIGSGPAYDDKSLNKDDFVRGAITHMKMIDGWLYACSQGRGFAKRLGKANWSDLGPHTPLDEKTYFSEGFEDFDAFSENEIYAAGGNGDVWMFDGKEWRQIPFPSNIPLGTVCCGQDGEVYISGQSGITFRGRNDRWTRLEDDYDSDLELSFRDMVWYEDKVWCSSDYGLWVIDNGKVVEADVPDWVSACSGDLSAGDGILLLSGYGGAVFRENGEWHKIVIFDEMEELLAKENGKS